ncbi:MAG: PAS domain-containing protein [Burkholderiales bacterium]|nr:PAS domain-containing protein [Burkholderiales bacterium]
MGRGTHSSDTSSARKSDSEAAASSGAAPAVAAFDGYVVAIGASAGGLDALERLFDRLPADSGAAFVVIQHLSPDHKSMMDNLLSRHTQMPVQVATQGMPLAANHVFLIPPGMTMTLDAARLQLVKKPEHGLSLPIDAFFRSMAENFGPRALALVLSGTGSDGARGALTVNEEGGVVMVQSPDSAKFDGMPRSAIATGLVDDVANPEELARRLIDYLRSAPMEREAVGEGTRRGSPLADLHLSSLDAVLQSLMSASGINFREYKPATVIRRIERRMQVRHSRSFAEYLNYLQQEPDEVATLRRELLIPVTRFFRDPEAFDYLAKEVVPRLVGAQASNEPLRVWVAACSTGEEAYSIAILFAEAFSRLQRWPSLKIFATDIEQEYLDHASAGVYPATIAAEVSAERLERFFVHRGGSYVVRNELRQHMIFARHNLVDDPPFTRMHLVTCRNMLIYLQPRAQDAVLSRLHYALTTDGHLFLGPSESIGPLHDDFAAVSAKNKIFKALRRGRAVMTTAGGGKSASARQRLSAYTGRRIAGPDASLQQSALSVLLSDFSPPALLIGRDRSLVHVFGGGRRYLQIPEGDASLDVLNLLPKPLAASAAAMIHVAQRSPAPGKPVEPTERRSHVIEIALPYGTTERVQLVARPLPNEQGEGDGGLLLVFEPVPTAPVAVDAGANVDLQSHIETLERELTGTRANLQQTIEELETANEELQATNEELIASNEELQSTNEELQSVNEELFTVNAEYQEKVDVLNRVNADLENVSRATSIATLFIDEDLQLSRFTPEASLLFKIKTTDVGRSIEDFANLLDYPEFFSDLRRTLRDGHVIQREVADRERRWYLARIQPYSQTAHAARRAVVSFIDVSSVKDAQRLQAVIDSLPEHLAVLDAGGMIQLVNQAWRDFARANGDLELTRTGPGTNYLRACEPVDDEFARAAQAGLIDVLAGRRNTFTLQYPCHSHAEQRWFLMHAAPINWPGGGAVVSHVNITSFMLQSDDRSPA